MISLAIKTAKVQKEAEMVTDMSLLSVKDLSAGYGSGDVIREASFSVKKGEVCGILGANGSGKTTLLNAVCGIISHKGRCVAAGERLESMPAKKLAQICSYIPQRSGISIDLPVLEVVLMGFNPQLGLLQYPDSEMKAKAREAIELVGLGGMEEKNYLTLSEGQKQLVILARSIASRCRVMFMDEPESALDFRVRYRMMELIRNWVKENDSCTLITLHDIGLALNYCDKLLLIGDGRIREELLPGEESCESMEEKLSRIYGPVSVRIVTGRVGKSQLVMLRETE